MKAAKALPFSDHRVQALLAQHNCPVPYREVRTRFLGNIATPDLSASPMTTLQGLWGGALPRFEDLETAKELISLLINGLWNSLTRHQKRTQPFRLVRPPIEPTPAGLSAFALIRQQELDGFVEGLFNGDDNIALPESAWRSLDVLAEARGMMVGVYSLANDPTKMRA